jgi:hypothetical protein
MPRPAEPPLHDENGDSKLHWAWEHYPQEDYYIDGDGNQIDWVWNAQLWYWLPEGYTLDTDGMWIKDA